MITVKVTCDMCKAESFEFSVRKENDVFQKINASSYEFITYPGQPEKLVGPDCKKAYKEKLTEAEQAKNKVINDWFAAQKGQGPA